MKAFCISAASRVIIFAASAAFLFAGEPPKQATTVNSLGMKFAAVGDVQFSVYLTTRKDFEAFATATHLKSEAWRNPGFEQGPDHPVVNVSWREANAFCDWLTKKERNAGLLKAKECYRLPTDLEWSKAVGLPAEKGATPEERDMGVPDVYPWGKKWPPPHDAGNYSAEPESQTEIPLPGFDDGYRYTSPVGKFRVNAFGLYDMGGNVWQWISDDWNAGPSATSMRGNIWKWMADLWKSKSPPKTLRGASWYNGAIPLSLLSSCRISSSPDTMHDTYGFRIVRATDSEQRWWFILKSSVFALLLLLLMCVVAKRASMRARKRSAPTIAPFGF